MSYRSTKSGRENLATHSWAERLGGAGPGRAGPGTDGREGPAGTGRAGRNLEFATAGPGRAGRDCKFALKPGRAGPA